MIGYQGNQHSTVYCTCVVHTFVLVLADLFPSVDDDSIPHMHILLWHIYSYDNYTELQSDINLINNWTSENHLVFNTSKCKQMVISRKRNQYNFHTILLGNEALELVQRYKYLGVTITSNLSWSEHINTKCLKAKKLIGLLYRRFYGNANPIALFELYTALVPLKYHYIHSYAYCFWV